MSTPTVIQACAALYGVVPGASFVSTINTELSSVFAGDEDALLNHYYELVFVVNNGDTSEEVAARIVANLGLTGEEATSETARIAAELEATPVKERGAKVKDLIDEFEASGSEVALAFTALKSALETAVADPAYEGIQGKNVVFSQLSAANIELGTDAAISEVTLATGSETVNGGDGIDLISGVVSNLSSLRTMDVTDSIDGGDGEDVLSLQMNGNFGPVTSGTGSISNIETVKLFNNTTIAREFDATGITGVAEYQINATSAGVSLKNLQESGLTISFSGQTSGELETTFKTTTVTEGSSTEMKFGLSGIGSSSADVGLKTSGVEFYSLSSKGASKNYVTLTSATDLKGVTVDGSADLSIKAIPTTVTSFDASGSTGAQTVVLSAGALSTITGGSANDSFTVDTTTGKLRANATIDGGEGADTLVIGGSNAAATTIQPIMSGVEKISVATVSGGITVDMLNVTDVETLSVAASIAQDVTLSSMGSTPIAIELNDANSNGTKTVSVDTTGAVNVSTKRAASSTTGVDNEMDVTASKATGEVTLTIADLTEYGGLLTATKASSVNVTAGAAKDASSVQVTGFLGGISAPEATSFSITTGGTLGTSTTDATVSAAKATYGSITTGTEAAYVKLTTGKMETLDITANNSISVDSASTLTTLYTVNATQNKGTLTLGDLAALNNLVISGPGTTSGSESTASLGDLGAKGSSGSDYPLSVTATGFKGGVTLGSGKEIGNKSGDIDLNFSGVTGNVDLADGVTATAGSIVVNIDGTGSSTSSTVYLGTLTADTGSVTVIATNADGAVKKASATAAVPISAKTGVTYLGTTESANAADITVASAASSFTASLAGGIADDTYTITSGGTSLSSLSVTGDLSIGTNSLTIKLTDAKSTGVTINASGVSNSSVKIIGSPNDANTITATGKGDTIVGGTGNDLVDAGAGNDVIYSNGGINTYTLGTGNDIIRYTAAPPSDNKLVAGSSNKEDDGTTSLGIIAGTDTLADLQTAGNTYATDKLDKVTDFGKSGYGSDTISFSTGATIAAVTASTALNTAGQVGLITGVHSGGVFTTKTVANGATDSILLYVAAGGTINGILLLGYASGEAGSHSVAGDGVTAALANLTGFAENSGGPYTGLVGGTA